ncbi:hypothetical protein ACHAPU_006296 [Fusarium lateritium]
MKTSFAILSASMASVMAGPFSTSTHRCNVAPSAAVNGKVHPYHHGKADTAVDCQTFCTSDDSCKSFAFGLVKGAHHSSCLLFEVPAAEVPARKDGLHVFDRECTTDRVPTSAPTTAQPWGTVPKKMLVRRATKCNCAASGSANIDIQPFKTSIAATAKDCQALAEADTSCLSFLYGLPDDSKSPICKLYKVAASRIPARGDKLFVFDKGCSSKQVPTTAPTEDAPRGLVPGASKVNKAIKVEGKKVENEGDYKVSDAKPKATKIQNPKPKATKNLNPKPKATKSAKVENKKMQYAEPTKVSSPKVKVTKVADVNYDNNAKNTEAKDTKSKGSKARIEDNKQTKAQDNKQAKATKSQNQEHQATKVAEVNSNKDTKVNKAEGTDNKDAKVESPKTMVTKVRVNEQQATQAAKADGNKSDCKTTKVSNAQPKVTQAY